MPRRISEPSRSSIDEDIAEGIDPADFAADADRRPASNCACTERVPAANPALTAQAAPATSTMPGNFAPFEAKMRADGLSDAAVAAFKNAYDALTSGAPQRCSSRGRLLIA